MAPTGVARPGGLPDTGGVGLGSILTGLLLLVAGGTVLTATRRGRRE